ncbi:DNA-binding transcriptional regulator, LysR family [Caballeronia arationis]|jgi:DNA-binding transcriptional LysR family regulator|uniref:DNA-binding transcriptional regulator, LysR family n=1 Tax=Caballeronia arationis TaxID=1777142 RepID=A0A7Z7ID87_9BURK|nr:LysR family transcriptional regulator [Caballeronia arationis]SOE88591.1 DNA-binding transcriptional regulator, LysR family [Caballeronia arationis]
MIAPASTIRKRLRLRHLQLMVALSETESLRSAADELAMTQPAATKALKELEDTVGVSLFVRHARGMEATIYGEAVMRYARVVFEDLDELREELAAIEAGDIGKVRIGAVMAPAPDLLTRVIVTLKEAHPRLQITVQIDTSDVLVQALQQDQLDIVVGRIPYGFPALDLSFETLSEEALSIVARPEHPVANAPAKPKLAELAAYPWIVQPHPSPMRQVIDQTFRESRVAPPVSTVETSSILTTLSLLRDSDMLAVLPSSVAQYYAALNTIATLPTPLRGRLAPYGLILRKNRRISPATQLVIDAIRAA